MDYDRETLINHKVVRICPGLRRFLHEVQNLAHVIVWSSMTLKNTKPIISLVFRSIIAYLALSCNELLNKRGKLVPKVGGGWRAEVSQSLEAQALGPRSTLPCLHPPNATAVRHGLGCSTNIHFIHSGLLRRLEFLLLLAQPSKHGSSSTTTPWRVT